MARFIKIPEGESTRLVNLAHVREALFNPQQKRLSLHLISLGNEHLITLEGAVAEATYTQLVNSHDE